MVVVIALLSQEEVERASVRKHVRRDWSLASGSKIVKK